MASDDDLLEMLDLIARSLTFASDTGMVQTTAKDAAAEVRELRAENADLRDQISVMLRGRDAAAADASGSAPSTPRP